MPTDILVPNFVEIFFSSIRDEKYICQSSPVVSASIQRGLANDGAVSFAVSVCV